MAIDQASRTVYETMMARTAKPWIDSTPEEVRKAGEGSWRAYGSGPGMASVSNHLVTSTDGSTFPVRVLVPTASPRATIVYYHGGGWVLGEIDGFDTLGRTIAALANATVVLVGYRLAPEHPFPAATDDAWSALEWVDSNRASVSGLAQPIVVAGDSAGGNLAIVTALRARSAGPKISGVLLAYPVTDADTSRPSYTDPENQLVVSKRVMEWFFDHYVDHRERADPRVSPLRAEDFSGFPPTALLLAEHDPLRDEGEEFAMRLRQAGVDVRDRVFEGQMHIFFQMVNVLPASKDAIDWFVEQLDMTVFANKQEKS
jgi:acetyl esterase